MYEFCSFPLGAPLAAWLPDGDAGDVAPTVGEAEGCGGVGCAC